MQRLVPVKYVGNKPVAFDNITRSGKSWAGKGDVQEVTDAQARELIKYTDQWQLVDPDDAELVNAPVSITVNDENGDEHVVDPDALKKPLEQMVRVELIAYAMQAFGKELDPKATKKTMIDQIEEMKAGLDPVSTV